MIDANELRAAIRRIQWKPVHGSDDDYAVDMTELLNEIDRLERVITIEHPAWTLRKFISVKEARQWLLDEGLSAASIDRAVYKASDGTLIKLERTDEKGGA